MYNYEIENYFKKCKHFLGVYPRDMLPTEISKRPCGLIINTDKAADPGTHWVSICLLKNNRGEYFDSFGLRPLHKEIKEFLEHNCSGGWTDNSCTLQHPLATSCGLYSVAFLYNRFNNTSFQTFLASFTPNTRLNEKLLMKKLKKRWSHEK